jgi:uncharacterized protein (TIGR00106 family)
MLAFFSIAPTGADDHLGAYVAEMLDLIDQSGLDYRFGSMGTTVEGDWEEVIALIGRCHALMAEKAPRVATSIKIDDQVGRSGRLTGKVDSVEKTLGRKLRK